MSVLLIYVSNRDPTKVGIFREIENRKSQRKGDSLLFIGSVTIPYSIQGPPLVAWINLNPSMDKQSHGQ